MMGTQLAPARLFYDFDFESHVPDDHLLRQIDRFLDLDGMRDQLRPFYSRLGRPSPAGVRGDGGALPQGGPCLGRGFAVDASLIPADANKTRSLPASEWSPEVARKVGSRAAREYLEMLDDAAFGAASPSQPKFVAKFDPGGPVDPCRGKPALLRLCRQLPDRHQVLGDHGR